MSDDEGSSSEAALPSVRSLGQQEFDLILGNFTPSAPRPLPANYWEARSDVLAARFKNRAGLLRIFSNLPFHVPFASFSQSEWDQLLDWCGEEHERQCQEQEQQRQEQEQQRERTHREEALRCPLL